MKLQQLFDVLGTLTYIEVYRMEKAILSPFDEPELVYMGVYDAQEFSFVNKKCVVKFMRELNGSLVIYYYEKEGKK